MVTFNDIIYYWSRYKADMHPETRNDFLRVFSRFYDELISLGKGVGDSRTSDKPTGKIQDNKKKDAITLAGEAAAEKHKALMYVAKNWEKPGRLGSVEFAEKAAIEKHGHLIKIMKELKEGE